MIHLPGMYADYGAEFFDVDSDGAKVATPVLTTWAFVSNFEDVDELPTPEFGQYETGSSLFLIPEPEGDISRIYPGMVFETTFFLDSDPTVYDVIAIDPNRRIGYWAIGGRRRR